MVTARHGSRKSCVGFEPASMWQRRLRLKSKTPLVGWSVVNWSTAAVSDFFLSSFALVPTPEVARARCVSPKLRAQLDSEDARAMWRVTLGSFGFVRPGEQGASYALHNVCRLSCPALEWLVEASLHSMDLRYPYPLRCGCPFLVGRRSASGSDAVFPGGVPLLRIAGEDDLARLLGALLLLTSELLSVSVLPPGFPVYGDNGIYDCRVPCAEVFTFVVFQFEPMEALTAMAEAMRVERRLGMFGRRRLPRQLTGFTITPSLEQRIRRGMDPDWATNGPMIVQSRPVALPPFFVHNGHRFLTAEVRLVLEAHQEDVDGAPGQVAAMLSTNRLLGLRGSPAQVSAALRYDVLPLKASGDFSVMGGLVRALGQPQAVAFGGATVRDGESRRLVRN